jgi:hypothetical protein
MEEWLKTHSPYLICIAVLFLWGLRITPEVKNTASLDYAQIQELNKNLEDLKKVDVRPRIFPCGLTGSL